MNRFIIMFFVFFTYILTGCGRGDKIDKGDCDENLIWNEESNTCEEKPNEEITSSTEEQCKKEKTKIWDTENSSCREKTQNECNTEHVKWENGKCVKEEVPEETEALYTITNNSSITIAVQAFDDPSIFLEVDRSDYHTLDTQERWAHGSLEPGQCLSVVESQFITSLQIRRTAAGVISCDNFHVDSFKKCGDNADQPIHLIINNHPTPEGRRYEWVVIETATEKNSDNCPLLERRS